MGIRVRVCVPEGDEYSNSRMHARMQNTNEFKVRELPSRAIQPQ